MTRPFVVSTDCAGIFGSVKAWEGVWGEILQMPSCKGVEMIGWAWSPDLMKKAAKRGIPIIGIHGRTAGWREDKSFYGKAILGSLNELFVTNTKLTKLAKNVEYILLHRSAIRTKVVKLLLKHKDTIKHINIENVFTPHDFEKTLETVDYLHDLGFSTGIMFDLVHFLREPYQKAPQLQHFDSLLKALEILSETDIPVSVHFPIGTYASDSLPLDRFSESMWRDLAVSLKRLNPTYIVLENQQRRAYSIFLSQSKWAEVHSRNRRVVETLFEKDIL